jgi:hypothetical protein
VEANGSIKVPDCYGLEEPLKFEEKQESFISMTGDKVFDAETNSIVSTGRITVHVAEIPPEDFGHFKDVISDLTEPTSIIIYPLKEKVEEKTGEVSTLVDESAAGDDEKKKWRTRLSKTQEMVEDGKCQKALDDLDKLSGVIKSYKPPVKEQVEGVESKPQPKTTAPAKQQPQPKKEKADTTPLIIGGAVLLVIILAAVIVLKKK